VPERLRTLDAHGLKLSQIYLRVNVAPGKQAYDPSLKEVAKLLEGRGTILGLLVAGGKPSDPALDPRAVEVLREIADLAAEQGLRVAIYPHTNNWAETVEDALRVVKKADRKNLGVMFNLCHWLKTGGEAKGIEPLLKDAKPHLLAVTINGADAGLGRRGGWDRLIQPLGSGSFDVHGLLRTLRALGYTGPIGLQCYGLRGDARDHLARSMAAWRNRQERLAAEQQ
jgi:sugar phosphate isomerase/epimerase